MKKWWVTEKFWLQIQIQPIGIHLLLPLSYSQIWGWHSSTPGKERPTCCAPLCPFDPQLTIKQKFVFDACHNKDGLHVVAFWQGLGSSVGETPQHTGSQNPSMNSCHTPSSLLVPQSHPLIPKILSSTTHKIQKWSTHPIHNFRFTRGEETD